MMPVNKKRKKPLFRRVKHRVETFGRRHWTIVFAVLGGVFTAYWVMPYLIRILNGSD